jgi:PiT family inorganic phosphate transporter
MDPDLVIIILFVALALVFDFLNGFHDCANIVATMISSRAMTPVKALAITAICEFLGPFLFGLAVAKTIGNDVVEGDLITLTLIFSALLSACIWNIITWYLGIPSSSSHALIGGIVGSALMSNLILKIGLGKINSLDEIYAVAGIIKSAGIIKVLLSLLISPLAGFIAGFIIIKIIYLVARGFSPNVNWFFKKSQIFTAIGLALSHGSNDAQKTMGIIAMGLFAKGFSSRFEVPLWVIVACSAAIALGTATGGWRLIKTIGGKFFKIRPLHGFTTQISSASVILMASLIGGPVSTTHVVSSAVMGAGSAERISKVRWGVGKQIVTAWLLTIPVTAIIAGIIYLIIWSLS